MWRHRLLARKQPWLHIHIDELDDEVFTHEEEELQMCLQLDRWGEVSLVLDDSYSVWGMNRAVANCVVIRWGFSPRSSRRRACCS